MIVGNTPYCEADAERDSEASRNDEAIIECNNGHRGLNTLQSRTQLSVPAGPIHHLTSTADLISLEQRARGLYPELVSAKRR
jgi:hypothetical protein